MTRHEGIELFRRWLADQLAQDTRFGAPTAEDRPDGSTLTTRWPVGEAVWIQVTLRPLIPEVRVGVVTDNRWKSEEMEQAIEDSGESMYEFVGLGFGDAGLDWDEPPVEHYRDQLTWMCFSTPLEIQSLGALADEVVRVKIRRMVEGYCLAFAAFLCR